jgi:hypothetical protein
MKWSFVLTLDTTTPVAAPTTPTGSTREVPLAAF